MKIERPAPECRALLYKKCSKRKVLTAFCGLILLYSFARLLVGALFQGYFQYRVYFVQLGGDCE